MTSQSEAIQSSSLAIGSSLSQVGIMGALKRSFDLVAALMGLLFLSPLLIVIAILIRADGGPALFGQRRVGRQGKSFRCFKFRSMVMDAEARLENLLSSDPKARTEWDIYQKLTIDPRITPIGRLLRKTSLDELPQLINVLTGEMSLVGPRPMLPAQKAAYGSALGSYMKVRPGITGHWQVNGRNTTTFERRAELDQWYVENWSLRRDGWILILTVREVFFAGGQ